MQRKLVIGLFAIFMASPAFAQFQGGGLSAGGYFRVAATAAPTINTAPTVSGTAQVGSTLTGTNGSWTNSPTSYAYQWYYADTSAIITGATSITYVPVTGDIGHTLEICVTATNTGGNATSCSAATAAVTSGAVIASVDPSGWMVTPTTPAASYSPDTSPVTVAVTHGGYGADGLYHAANYTENYTLTSRVRNAYPNDTTLNGSLTAVNDWIYASDSVAGLGTNGGSTAVSPKPVAYWLTPDRQYLTGSSLTIQLAAYHRNAHSQGAPVPYVGCTATDGTNSDIEVATYNAALPGIAQYGSTDRHKIMGYSVTFNISAFANPGAFTVNCKVYPWASDNTTTSVLDSSTSPTFGFSTLNFYRNTTARPVYYVANTTATPAGSDSTGTGTSAAPFATLQKAELALCPTSTCVRSGATIYIKEDSLGAGATFSAGALSPVYQDSGLGEMIVAKDPAATGTVNLTLSQSINFKTPYVHIENLSIARNAYQITANGGSGNHVVLDNSPIDVTGGTTTLTSSGGLLYVLGGSFNNMSSSVGAISLQDSTSQRVALLRSVNIPAAANGLVNVGCNGAFGVDATGAACVIATPTYAYDGTVVGHSQFLAVGGTADLFNITLSSTALANISGVVVVDTIFEPTNGSVTSVGVGLSRDPPTGGQINNLIFWNVTGAGTNNAGRWNIAYDNDNSSGSNCIGGTGSPNYCGVRNHGYFSFVGVSVPQFNIKNDRFVALSGADTTDAPFHTGNFPQYYGVGFRDNVIAYNDANGYVIGTPSMLTSANDFSQAYGGLNTAIGTGYNTRTDLYTGYAGATFSGTSQASGTYTAGAGNGTYLPCSAVAGACTAISPLYQHMKGPSLLPFTLAGTAIPATNANAGAQ